MINSTKQSAQLIKGEPSELLVGGPMQRETSTASPGSLWPWQPETEAGRVWEERGGGGHQLAEEEDALAGSLL